MRRQALTGYGNDTSPFRNNLIGCGGATRVTQALIVSGRFKLIDHHIASLEGNDTTTRP